MFNKSMLLQTRKKVESVTIVVDVGSWQDEGGYIILGYDEEANAGSISNAEFFGTKVNQIVFTFFDPGEAPSTVPPSFSGAKIRFDTEPSPCPNKLHVKVESKHLNTDQTEYMFERVAEGVYLSERIGIRFYGDFPVTVTITPYDFE